MPSTPATPVTQASAAASGRELIASLVADLAVESAELRAVLATLSHADWGRMTPADGWTITDQVTHLAYFDDVTRLPLTDPDQFKIEAAQLMAAGQDFADRIAARFHDIAPPDLLNWFETAREQLTTAFLGVDPATRLPWYGPPMSPASSVTARLMETWAHGQDVLDTLGLPRAPSSRLRQVADLGIRALRYTYTVNGLDLPAEPMRVELTGPDGAPWSWGPADAANRVTGDALDFCLVVTQRRHRDDTALVITGDTASQWIGIAQAFAGPAGPGRPPGHVRAAAPVAAPAATSTGGL